jgi:hypothetical protein
MSSYVVLRPGLGSIESVVARMQLAGLVPNPLDNVQSADRVCSSSL